MTRTDTFLRQTLLVGLFLSSVGVVIGAEIGKMATIERNTGDRLGPYRVQELNSNHNSAVALPQTAEEEGSGEFALGYDDTEVGSDIDPETLWEKIPELDLPSMDDNIRPVLYKDYEQPTNKPNVQPLLMSSSKPTAPAAATTTRSSTGHPTTPVVTADPLCHEACIAKLHSSFQLSMSPNETLLATGEDMTMTCQVEKALQGSVETVELQWLFEGESSPQGECSLVEDQKYLAVCEGFSEITKKRNSNTTHLIESTSVSHLHHHNTGYFICQAVVHCCGNVVFQQKRQYVRVWYADYTTQLLLLTSLAVGLSVLLVTGLVYQRRKDAQIKQNYVQVLVVPGLLQDAASTRGRVLPLPMDDKDTASLDSFEEYSD